MSEPMRIRASALAGTTTVRVQLAHEMESGLRKDPSGEYVPVWHITEVTATLNGKPVFACEWGPSVARNPVLQFKLKGGQSGDRIALTWKDSRGDTRTDEAVVV